MGKPENKKKVIVALSGGVDSAVAAALLQKQGFGVAAVYFHFFGEPKDTAALRRVRKIAKKQGIDFFEIDAIKEFRKIIIDRFVDSYRRGLTPNPCVICNKEIKLDLLLGLLKKHKADYVATGHYAKNVKCQMSKVKSKEGFIFKLLRAKDKTKDQSYFLYRLTQKDLAKIVFPLGDYKKSEVKKLAKKMKLPVAKEESQDICFLLDKGINAFLEKYIKPIEGSIVDENGKVLAKHKGLPFYTIGQRKGIELGGTGPYFVIGKNTRKNELVVSSDPKKLLTKKFAVNQVNWINEKIKFPLRAKVQIRYRAEKIPAIIRKVGGGKWEVGSGKPLRAVTPGQSAVFYRENEVLGGGMIVECKNQKSK